MGGYFRTIPALFYVLDSDTTIASIDRYKIVDNEFVIPALKSPLATKLMFVTRSELFRRGRGGGGRGGFFFRVIPDFSRFSILSIGSRADPLKSRH